MTIATESLHSPGYLCANLQQPYSRIKKAVETLNIKAAVTINGVGHYNAEQAEQIADHIKAQAEKRTKR